MSDDEADPELLELLRQRFGISNAPVDGVSPNTTHLKQTRGPILFYPSRNFTEACTKDVLRDAEYVNNNAIDVFIDMFGTKAAAVSIYRNMQDRGYSTETWGAHELHPTPAEGFTEVDLVNFIFTMDLLNFCFWSELAENERFQVEYKGKRWTGYTSLVASLRRALDDGIPITTPRFWRSKHFTNELMSRVFRSATSEQMPLLEERIAILRDASIILFEDFADEDEEGEEDDDNGKANVEIDKTVEGITGATAQSGVIESVTLPHSSSILPSAPTLTDPRPPSPRAEAIETEEAGMAQSEGDRVAKQSSATVEAQVPNTDSTPVEASNTRLDTAETKSVPEAVPQTMGPDLTVIRVIERASHSAGKLVNLLAKHFPAFRDETRFEGRNVRFLKRAQIFVADVWAALNGSGCGEFHDIDHLTMFADYRVPQMLHSLGVIRYSPPLEYHVSALKRLHSGHPWEVQLRGCSIWAVELIRREILKAHPASTVNAVLIDFFLYDLAKERERSDLPTIPHHRVRTQWY